MCLRLKPIWKKIVITVTCVDTHTICPTYIHNMGKSIKTYIIFSIRLLN